ncbi:MAG: hypothetical protein RKO24_03235, partial [Candidatus Competibacter sp.]|nr:hypothetical protein [Candidatus Competibacter sp.]
FIQEGSRGLRFASPARIVTTLWPDEMVPALRVIETAVTQQHRHHAAGFTGYEAAAAYGPTVQTPMPDPPLLGFGLCEKVEAIEDRAAGILNPPPTASHAAGSWQSTLGRATYETVVGRVKDYLARGHSHQVNFTSPLRASFLTMHPIIHKFIQLRRLP